MFLSILALSSYLLLLTNLARAQISAPNCTNEATYTWVGSFLRRLSVCVDIKAFAPCRLFHILGLQFSRPKSLLGCCVPGIGMQQWRLVICALWCKVCRLIGES